MQDYNKIFKDKVVVVTGGGRGLGKAMGEGFAECGAKVALLATTDKQVKQAAEEINAKGGRAIGLAVDVTNYESLENAYKKIDEEFGGNGFDVLLLNAGVDLTRKKVGEDEISDWIRVIDVNLKGAYNSARAAIPYLKTNDGGKIIATGSGIGKKAGPGSSSYGSAKAGLRMLVKCLALELKDYNIACNEIYPGPVNTEMNKAYFDGTLKASFFEGEWLKMPEEMVPLVLFVASLPNYGTSSQLFSLTKRDV